MNKFSDQEIIDSVLKGNESDYSIIIYRYKNKAFSLLKRMLKNDFDAEEVVQLYVRDLVGSRTRPVKELKGFRRISLKSGEAQKVLFQLNTNELGFHNQDMQYVSQWLH